MDSDGLVDNKMMRAAFAEHCNECSLRDGSIGLKRDSK